LTGNLTIAIFGFAGFALLARTYSIDEFGKWVLYISSAVFVEMFRFGITNTAIIRYLAGVGEEKRYNFIGSNGLIGLIATAFIAIVLWSCQLLFPEPIKNAGYELFFVWYPILAFVNLPLNTALVIVQADMQFGKLLTIKFMNSIGFFLILLANFLFLHLSLKYLVWSQISVNIITSAICFYKGWDGLRYIRRANSEATKTILSFGKYTTFTLIGTNLLRSADTLIISLSPLGTAAVALYSIPMKLTELQQIPLRSFVATAFPKMSKASIQNNINEVKNLFYTYSGAMTFLFIFVSLFTFIFADYFVLILGGRQYLGIDPVTGFSTTTIVRIFSIYGLLLPIDRMTGVALDSINQPKLNFYKVSFMVAANVIGDLIAVFYFKSLNAVAIGSILFTLLGIFLGYYYLKLRMELKLNSVFTSGMDFYRQMFKKVLKK